MLGSSWRAARLSLPFLLRGGGLGSSMARPHPSVLCPSVSVALLHPQPRPSASPVPSCLPAQAARLQGRLHNSDSALDATRAQLAATASDLEEERAALEEARTDLEEARAALEEAQVQGTDLGGQASSLRARVVQLEAQLEASEAQVRCAHKGCRWQQFRRACRAMGELRALWWYACPRWMQATFVNGFQPAR